MKVSDCLFPSNKALLWERFDWSKSSRTSAQYSVQFDASATFGTEQLPPMWNNPEAQPGVASVDGSVRKIKVSEIYDKMWDDNSSNPNDIPAYRPADDLQIPYRILRPSPQGYDMWADGLETGDPQVSKGLYPAIFWATRDGMRGRDF